MLPPYRYQCVDRSVLVPYLKRWVVEPVARVTPLAIPANMITIGTNVFMGIGVLLAAKYGPSLWANFLLLPLFMFIYAVGDHLDGLQAKRTNTGSALGEFCDHYLDAFNTGIVVYFALALFRVEHPIAVPLVFVSVYATGAAVAYEEFRTGWLNFEQFGSLEGVALVIVLILAGAIPACYTALTAASLPYGLTPMLVIMLATSIGGILTVAGSFRRGGVSARFLLFLGMLVTLAVYAYFRADAWRSFLLFSLYGAHYCGAMLNAHLITKREPLPDLAVPLLLVGTFAAGVEPGWLFGAGVAYLLLRNAVITVQTFAPLRSFWYWKNPDRSGGQNS